MRYLIWTHFSLSYERSLAVKCLDQSIVLRCFVRWRQSCVVVDSCIAGFSGSSSRSHCTDGSPLPASGAQLLCNTVTAANAYSFHTIMCIVSLIHWLAQGHIKVIEVGRRNLSCLSVLYLFCCFMICSRVKVLVTWFLIWGLIKMVKTRKNVRCWFRFRFVRTWTNMQPQTTLIILVWFLTVSLAAAAIIPHGRRFTRHTHFKALCNVAHPVCVWPVPHCTVGCPGLQSEFHTEPTGEQQQGHEGHTVIPVILWPTDLNRGLTWTPTAHKRSSNAVNLRQHWNNLLNHTT